MGLEWNLVLGCFSITHNRIEKYLQIIDRFLSSAPYITARDCATLAGHIMSMSPVVGHLTRLKTRHLYRVIEARRSWTSRINIGVHNEALAEIFFWKNNVKNLNVKEIFAYDVPLILSYSDASSVACGAFIAGSNAVCHRMWNEFEIKQSSTWRELKAIYFSLLSFRLLLSGKSVKCHSDNQAAVRIIEVGSPNANLHDIAHDIFTFCHVNRVTLTPQWIPRNLNLYADTISKKIDYDDWSTTPEFFAYLDGVWGPHTVDRFASQKNAQLIRFNSRFYVPGTETIDAFSVSWADENNWLVPPVHCVTRVIQHMIASQASGTLVVPFWPSSIFWPFLFCNAHICHPYVIEKIVFPNAKGIFILGDFKDSLIGSPKFTSEVLAVRIEL